MSLRYLINIETGKNLPSIEMLIKLSIALETDPVEMFESIYKILYDK
ncbi:MAG: helix-turn-helix domain-containing protein [Oscillospiraceae bacterium]